MFGFITRAEHERIVAKVKRERDDALLAHKLTRAANTELRGKLSVFTAPRQRDGKGRYLPVVAS